MDFYRFFTALALRLPLFLLWLIGIVYAIIRWRNHPRVSLAVVLGFIVLSITACITMMIPLLVSSISQSGNGTVINLFFMTGRITPFVDAVGWVLVLIAIFSDRKN
jgi:hypothetical protein